LLADTGRHSGVLSAGVSQDRVVAALGPPDAVCERYGVCWRELYAVVGKYPNRELQREYGDFDILTLFVGEAVLTPIELVRSAYKTVTPGTLEVVYCTIPPERNEPTVATYETLSPSKLDGAESELCRRP